jgi:NAD(P)-dependent dehydrogenase (short-subunit alcohol dehydrogenase family)
VVLDLRGNSGGLLPSLTAVSGLFVEKPTSLGTMTLGDGQSLQLMALPRQVSDDGREIRRHTGKLAILTDRGSIWDTTPERYDEIFDVNVKAPFFLMQDALHLMKKSKSKGTIVNILSMSGHGGQDFITAYCGSKGALAVLTRNVAFSVMRYQIRVNGLNIGWMDTPGEDRIMKTYHDAADGWLKKAEAARPFGRLLKPAEVARAVAYLSSDESGLMTGSIIDFDQQVLGAANATPEPPPANW